MDFAVFCCISRVIYSICLWFSSMIYCC